MAIRMSFGLIATLLWIIVAAVSVQELWPVLADLRASDIPALLAARSSELAFFWLVMGCIWLATGYFHHRAAFRLQARSMARVAEHVEAISRKLEADSRKLEDFQRNRIQAAQPVWEVQGCITHKEQHEISVRNTGAAASGIRVTWQRELPVVVALSNPALVDRGQQLTLKVMFLDGPLDEFTLTLEYFDALRETRRAYIAVCNTQIAVRHQEY